MIAGGPRAAFIPIPGRVPGQMTGHMTGNMTGHTANPQILGNRMPGKAPHQGLWQKQAPRPATAPRAVIAEPNSARPNHKAPVAMPVRQGATPPAQIVPKVPGARVETRLTIR